MSKGLGGIVVELGKPSGGDGEGERVEAAKAIAAALGVKLSDEKAMALSDALEEHRACCDMEGEDEDE